MDRADMDRQSQRVVVVGAGLAGVSAARQLAGHGFEVVLLERRDRIGGRARTEVVDGLPLDLGAQFIADFYRTTSGLVRTLGATEDLVGWSQRIYVLRGRSIEPIWPARDLLLGNVMSVAAKIRLFGILLSLTVHRRRLDMSDLEKSSPLDVRSASAYARRYVGTEVLEYFFAPLLRGLLYWDADSTSQAVLLSLLKAAAGYRKTYRMAGGTARLPELIVPGVGVETGVEVELIRRSEQGEFRVECKVADERRTLRAAGVVCATTASAAEQLVPWLPDHMSSFLASVSYTRTAIVTFRVDSMAGNYPPGEILFPVSTADDIACVGPCYSSADAGDRGPASRLVNIFLTDTGFEKYSGLSDEELGRTVLRRTRQLLGHARWVSGAELAHVWRWGEAIPRFRVGHIRDSHRFEEDQKEVAGLVFAGDYLGGPFMEGAINSGIGAADRLVRFLSGPPRRQQGS